MTSRLGQRARDSAALEKFPEFPPRDDLQNALHLYDDGHQAILRRQRRHLHRHRILRRRRPRLAGQVPGWLKELSRRRCWQA